MAEEDGGGLGQEDGAPKEEKRKELAKAEAPKELTLEEMFNTAPQGTEDTPYIPSGWRAAKTKASVRARPDNSVIARRPDGTYFQPEKGTSEYYQLIRALAASNWRAEAEAARKQSDANKQAYLGAMQKEHELGASVKGAEDARVAAERNLGELQLILDGSQDADKFRENQRQLQELTTQYKALQEQLAQLQGSKEGLDKAAANYTALLQERDAVQQELAKTKEQLAKATGIVGRTTTEHEAMTAKAKELEERMAVAEQNYWSARQDLHEAELGAGLDVKAHSALEAKLKEVDSARVAAERNYAAQQAELAKLHGQIGEWKKAYDLLKAQKKGAPADAAAPQPKHKVLKDAKGDTETLNTAPSGTPIITYHSGWDTYVRVTTPPAPPATPDGKPIEQNYFVTGGSVFDNKSGKPVSKADLPAGMYEAIVTAWDTKGGASKKPTK